VPVPRACNFLNVSRDEQLRRFMRRIDIPEKNWKFSAADVRERAHWDDYQRAFADVLSSTSTEWAPWHVIPADRKWFARLAAGAVILHEVMRIDPRYPRVGRDQLSELEEVRSALTQDGGPPDGRERPAAAAPARES